jgi:HD-like signal output (HDOD) protein
MSVGAVAALPPVPQVVGEILETIDDHSASFDQLEALVATEPALAAATLHDVNSAGLELGASVSSVGAAIQMIGLLRLRSLTVAHAVGSLRVSLVGPARESAERFWQHALRTGLLARLFAERTGCPWGEEAFVGGVLHDCGRLVLLAHHNPRYLELCAEHEPVPRLERAWFGTDHCEVGALLVQHWGLPEQLTATCRDHHQDISGDHPHAELLKLVQAADLAWSDLSVESARSLMMAIDLPTGEPLRVVQELRDEALALASEWGGSRVV